MFAVARVFKLLASHANNSHRLAFDTELLGLADSDLNVILLAGLDCELQV